MKMFELGRRMKENTELLSEIRDNLQNNKYTDAQVISCLLSDISVSLAEIADLMNYNTSINPEDSYNEKGTE